MIDSYGYPIKNINNLNQITVGENDYCYRNTRFLYCGTGMPQLIITFHGLVKPNLKCPIFRCYNRHYANTDLLAMSDSLVNQDVKYSLAWYLSTNNHNFEDVYQDVIRHFVGLYDKVLFFGTSGGGYPALKYSCIFNAACIIGNSQLYPEKYHHYPFLLERLNDNNDALIEKSINDIVMEHQPKLAYIYINVDDTHHYEEHVKPFKLFCEEHKITTIKIIEFKSNIITDNQHSVYFPIALPKIIKTVFSKMNTGRK